jgi:hypothetical protein
LWRCECAAFQERLDRYKERFCALVVIAIERLIEEGQSRFEAP